MEHFYSWLSIEEPLGVYICGKEDFANEGVYPLDDFFEESLHDLTASQAVAYAEKFEQFAKELRNYADRY